MVQLRVFIMAWLVFLSTWGFAEEEYQFKGVHFLASYAECDWEALANVDRLIEVMIQAVQECGATILLDDPLF